MSAVRPLSRALLASACCALSACGAPRIITPYRMDIQQGNYLSQEMVSQLRPGMTREQVRYILGTPLLTDIFHADRWDYVFYRDVQGGAREERKIAVLFEDGKLVRVVGDVVPAAPAEKAAAPESKRGESAPATVGQGAAPAPATPKGDAGAVAPPSKP